MGRSSWEKIVYEDMTPLKSTLSRRSFWKSPRLGSFFPTQASAYINQPLSVLVLANSSAGPWLIQHTKWLARNSKLQDCSIAAPLLSLGRICNHTKQSNEMSKMSFWKPDDLILVATALQDAVGAGPATS